MKPVYKSNYVPPLYAAPAVMPLPQRDPNTGGMLYPHLRGDGRIVWMTVPR